MNSFSRFGLFFSDFYDDVPKVHQAFLDFMEDLGTGWPRFARHDEGGGEHLDSKTLIDLAPWVEKFLGELFNLGPILAQKIEQAQSKKPLFEFKRSFIHRYALREYPHFQFENEPSLPDVLQCPSRQNFEELFAEQAQTYQTESETYSKEIEQCARYAAWATLSQKGQKRHAQGVLFKKPNKRDYEYLISHLEQSPEGLYSLPKDHQVSREGFNHTDPGVTADRAFDQAMYCIKCHPQGRDSCSKGLKSRLEDEPFQKDPFGHWLQGCPLEQKISEMNVLQEQGHSIAALAVITLDNPLVAGTGHRICNDCMKACIYQKQDAVDVPSVESFILKEVLDLPWGVEIYSLLTRWNPLNIGNPYPKPLSQKNVLVAGMGPAGMTLSHYLLNAGHTVLGIDGLKIEPLPRKWVKRTEEGKVDFEPIMDFSELNKPLEQRTATGMGGVSEYGITVRWNKNFLTVLRLLLERRAHFKVCGGVRMGGTLTTDQAFDLGFHHVALCMGAGKPTLLDIPGGDSKGIRTASDFLMALQLAGACHKGSLANLEIDLPVVVIGGGLTAIDTATEALAYYPLQLERFAARYSQNVEQKLTPEEKAKAHLWLERAEILKQCASWQEKREKLQEWGGSTMVYRRSLTQAPSYTLNAEEVEKALQEGIQILDEAIPLRVETDQSSHVSALWVSYKGQERRIEARTLLVAAGTQPNTALKYDSPNDFTVQGKHFQLYDEAGNPASIEPRHKASEHAFIARKTLEGKSVTIFGDQHPSFSGNVVKAMASGKKGSFVVCQQLEGLEPGPENFLKKTAPLFEAHVHSVERLTSTIVEVVIKAPLAARAFQPGQFYRLQNYASSAPKLGDAPLVMEALALTGAWVGTGQGLVSLIVLEVGVSSKLCAFLKPGEPVVLMGPTGTPTFIPEKEKVLLIGGGLGNAVLFSIGKAMREKGCQVLYFAGYKKSEDRYKVGEIEKAADQVVWCCDEEAGFSPGRPQDSSFAGNMIEALVDYGQNNKGRLSLSEIDRLIVIGSDGLMNAIAQARQGVLKSSLSSHHVALGSINSPMQCMMKEICAQCLQKHIDPQTGKEYFVYSCVEQDQQLDLVDFSYLRKRLLQNSLTEKVTDGWLEEQFEGFQIGGKSSVTGINAVIAKEGD